LYLVPVCIQIYCMKDPNLLSSAWTESPLSY